MSGIVRRNDLDRLMGWLLNVIGPGVGDVFFVTPSGSAYETWFKKIGVDSAHLFTTLALAYAATTTDRNDTILVAPGVYVQTAMLTWAKNHTHLVGLAGPLISGDWTTGDSCTIYTATTSVVDVIRVTGYGNQFHNVVVQNYGANAACVSAVRVGGYGNYFKNVAFHGNMTTTQCAAAACASLYITKDGDHPFFENCIIGQDTWGARAAANSGQLYFVDSGSGDRPNDGKFLNCQFLSTGTTDTAAMIVVASKNAAGRNWLFNNCSFQNFDEDATAMTRVFYHAQASLAQKGAFLFRHCSAQGYTEWQTDDGDVTRIDMPAKANAGGLMAEVTS